MAVDLLKLCDPNAYYSHFLREGLFPDGRAVDAFRTLSFKTSICSSPVVGSSLVRQGGVTVVCEINATLSLLSDKNVLEVKMTGGETSDEKQLLEVQHVLSDLAARGAFFPREALLATDPRLQWLLSAEIRVLNADGSVLDAALGGLLAALLDVQLPSVKLIHDDEDESPIDSTQIELLDEKVALKLSDLPVASTFYVYQAALKNGDIKSMLLCDPPRDVAGMCAVSCSIVCGSAGMIRLRTRGGCMDDSMKTRCFDSAQHRQKQVAAALSA